jgi:hypothetical protein
LSVSLTIEDERSKQEERRRKEMEAVMSNIGMRMRIKQISEPQGSK